MAVTDPLPIRRSTFDELSARDLHDILQLRSQVFVVEQDCAFLDIDGRDTEPTTEQLWVRDDQGVVVTVRLLHEHADVWSIGRVVTRPDARSSGIAGRVMVEGISLLDDRGATAIVLGAQAHLAGWYGRFGFEVNGDGYVEDDIAHVPMQRLRPDDGARR